MLNMQVDEDALLHLDGRPEIVIRRRYVTQCGRNNSGGERCGFYVGLID